MIGTTTQSTADYKDNEAEFSFPIQLVLFTDQPLFIQFKRRVSLPANQRTEKGDSPDGSVVDVHRAGQTWPIDDVPFPKGYYKFGNVEGIRFKTNGMNAATVYIIQVQQEDPEIQSFSPTA